MSAFRRIITNLSSTRRQYSVFSPKSGGGRYFNSAKAKAAEVAAKSTTSKSETATKDPSTAQNQDGTSYSGPQASRTVADTTTSPSPSNVTVTTRTVLPSQAATDLAKSIEELASLGSTLSATAPAHPTLTANDCKLHQFFSLHRPLLLLHNTAAMFAPAGPSFESVVSATFREEAEAAERPTPISVFEDFPTDPSIDADAVAARQLGRALAMSRIGAAASWENTLRHLGLDPSKEPERVGMQEQMNKDWEDVQILLDSTKRKRKKKMKKHKLKKRRRATRSARLKLR